MENEDKLIEAKPKGLNFDPNNLELQNILPSKLGIL